MTKQIFEREFIIPFTEELAKSADAVNAGIKDKLYHIQHGGNHYKSMAIQPMEYALANGLGYCEATAVKYISRWKLKGGVQDLDKAIHFLQLLKDDATNNPERYAINNNKGT